MSEDRCALVVDDERDIRELLVLTLTRMGLRVETAATLGMAKSQLANAKFDFCLTDMRLPDGSGLELLSHIADKYPEMPVAMLTAFGNVEAAVEALKLGAFDFVAKPVDLKVLRNLVQHALDLRTERKLAPKAPEPEKRMHGDSPAMAQLRQTIGKVARSQAPVYILGESGAGKELAARSIHDHSPRADGPFVPVNCGAIPPELMESEFFGHKKGSFTGAHADKQGLFQAANGGSLFLDEVAELPLSMQVKLLRAIQEKSVRPVGGQAEEGVDIRLISATHKDLSALVDEGKFRHDLYYRINVIELRVPPLRERVEDIGTLTTMILAKLSERHQMPNTKISNEALDALHAYPFPGNVRELENILERAMTLSDGQAIYPEDLNLPKVAPPAVSVPTETAAPDSPQERAFDAPIAPQSVGTPTGALPEALEQLEKQAIESALLENRYNKTKTAAQLGITFRALRYKLKKLGLD
ncbi:sigma-54-dependent Fis family transcriptional regulator [Lysobacter sp. HDW10]|uniref:sigma-54-dependent transcriptional regulator n=1 Tax=Lysobacter sp. HDW10 TaxID=2714936 RepID=UPI0014083533|nr:sigma-54 dependent transcriptional regulator [Lysobacter sp. HDW10]QIK80335.1 sigma-54-dependent Fis family transcriptional regulator [Lysobacter sp. HDW10]